jgi:hypothetical protein
MRKIPLILGILGILLGIVVAAGAYGLHATQLAHVSFEEAIPFVILGAILAFFSFVLAVVGVIIVMKGRSKPAA